MRRTLIIPTESGDVVSLTFTKRPELDSTTTFGTWNTATNEIEICTEGWDQVERNKQDVRKLRPLMDKFHKLLGATWFRKACHEEMRSMDPHEYRKLIEGNIV